MPSAKKPRAPRRRKPYQPTSSTNHDIWARTRLLVEVLIDVMEREIRAPEEQRSEQWLRLFGARDSAVVNLQKLVTLLAALEAQCPPPETPSEAVEPVSAAELALLSDWLRGTSAANVSAAPE